MSTPVIASCALAVAGAVIGSLPLTGGFRSLPRWIRIAQFLVGITFISSSGIAFYLYSAGERLPYPLHQFLFYHVVAIAGMGLGIILLLLVSGEYFSALRELDAARRRRIVSETAANATKNV
jgi:hypothetical protein